MSQVEEQRSKLMTFVAGEFARKEGRQCVSIELVYAPGNGFREEEIRKWVRAEDTELFDNFARIEQLVGSILEIAEMVTKHAPAETTVTESNGPRSYRVNSDKLLATGFTPKKSVEDAIKEIVAAYQAGEVVDEDRSYNLRWMQQHVLTGSAA